MSLDEYLTFGFESFDSLLELEVMQTKIMTCTSIRFYKDGKEGRGSSKSSAAGSHLRATYPHIKSKINERVRAIQSKQPHN